MHENLLIMIVFLSLGFLSLVCSGLVSNRRNISNVALSGKDSSGLLPVILEIASYQLMGLGLIFFLCTHLNDKTEVARCQELLEKGNATQKELELCSTKLNRE